MDLSGVFWVEGYFSYCILIFFSWYRAEGRAGIEGATLTKGIRHFSMLSFLCQAGCSRVFKIINIIQNVSLNNFSPPFLSLP